MEKPKILIIGEPEITKNFNLKNLISEPKNFDFFYSDIHEKVNYSDIEKYGILCFIYKDDLTFSRCLKVLSKIVKRADRFERELNIEFYACKGTTRKTRMQDFMAYY